MTRIRQIPIGAVVMQIGLALYLIVTGVTGIQTGNNEGLHVLKSLIGDVAILSIIMAGCQIAAGVLLLLNLFNISKFNSFLSISLIVIIVFWCIYIILYDFGGIRSVFTSVDSVVSWLRQLSPDLIILGGLLLLKGI